jgi:transcriptional regulator with GAF, ATPase, and Fis domain
MAGRPRPEVNTTQTAQLERRMLSQQKKGAEYKDKSEAAYREVDEIAAKLAALGWTTGRIAQTLGCTPQTAHLRIQRHREIERCAG